MADRDRDPSDRRLVAVPPAEVSVKSVDRDEGIDPWSFYVPPPNSRDNAKLWARVESDQAATIEGLILKGVFRWKNTSEFVRWAIVEGLNRAVRLSADPELNNAVQAMNVILRTVRLKQQQREMEQAMQDTEAFLLDMVKQGAIRQVKREVQAIRKEIDRMRESWWKERAELMLAKYEGIVEEEERRSAEAKAKAVVLGKRKAKPASRPVKRGAR